MQYSIDILYTMREFLSSRAEHCPDTAAFSYWNGDRSDFISVNSVELLAQTEELGAWLMAKGYHGSRIAILGDNSYPWMLSFFGITASGNVACLLDKSLPPRKLRQLMRDTDCEALFYGSLYKPAVDQIRNEMDIESVCMDDLPHIMELDRDLIESHRDIYRAYPVARDDLAVIAYTSGTSGKNKGVMLSHGNIVEDVTHGMRNMCFKGRTLLLLPLHHMFGVSATTLGTLGWGGTIYFNQGLRYIPQDIIKIQPNVIPAVPAMLPLIYRTMQGAKPTEPTKIICGGAPADGVWIERFRALGVELYAGYGMTECSPLIAVASELCERQDGSMRVIDGVTVKIDSPDKNGNGEILVQGPITMKGYYNMPEETAEALEGGWMHTGDIGRLEEGNYLIITGRKKNLLILSNGENVSAEELERWLMRIEGVTECITSVVNGAIQAEIYSASGKLEEIRRSIRERNGNLDQSRRIKNIVFRDTEFPKNSSQKIIRNFISKNETKK